MSADDLRESTDIWSLVTATGSPSAGASPARMVEYATRQAASGTGATPIDRQIVTCGDAASRLNGQWTAEIARAGTVFGRRIFPDARTEALARAELLAALPAAHDFLIGAARSAGEIMRQQMVLNAVHDAGEQWAAEAGNAAALRAYTEARAEAPDRLCLPGHRAPSGNLGAALEDRVRVPLCRGLPDGGAADADAGRGRRSSAPMSPGWCGCNRGGRSTPCCTGSAWARRPSACRPPRSCRAAISASRWWRRPASWPWRPTSR